MTNKGTCVVLSLHVDQAPASVIEISRDLTFALCRGSTHFHLNKQVARVGPQLLLSKCIGPRDNPSTIVVRPLRRIVACVPLFDAESFWTVFEPLFFLRDRDTADLKKGALNKIPGIFILDL